LSDKLSENYVAQCTFTRLV